MQPWSIDDRTATAGQWRAVTARELDRGLRIAFDILPGGYCKRLNSRHLPGLRMSTVGSASADCDGNALSRGLSTRAPTRRWAQSSGAGLAFGRSYAVPPEHLLERSSHAPPADRRRPRCRLSTGWRPPAGCSGRGGEDVGHRPPPWLRPPAGVGDGPHPPLRRWHVDGAEGTEGVDHRARTRQGLMVPDSPMPFAPRGLSGDGVCVLAASNDGISAALGMAYSARVEVSGLPSSS